MTLLADIAIPYAPLLLALVGLGIAAVANGMETGIYRLNRIRLRLRAGTGDRRARRLLALLGDVRGLICVCLVGYNGGVYLTTAFVTMMLAGAGLGEGPVGVEVLATVILTPVFFVFTDVTPKSIFTVEADRWMYRLGGVLRGAYHTLRAVGLVPALKGVSTLVLRIAHGGAAAANPFHPRQRLRAFLREGAAEGVITGYQDELVDRVLALRERQIRHAMIPMGQVTSVNVETGRRRFMQELRNHSCSRLPVWEGRRSHIVGIAHISEVMAADEDTFDLRALMSTEMVLLEPRMPVNQALVRMRRARAAMAIVRDARGRTVGIVTLKDLVEEIVGELAVW